MDAAIRLACERAIASEPNLTKWDMVMGDGDCGEAVKGVSEGKSILLRFRSLNRPELIHSSHSKNLRCGHYKIRLRFRSFACYN